VIGKCWTSEMIPYTSQLGKCAVLSVAQAPLFGIVIVLPDSKHIRP